MNFFKKLKSNDDSAKNTQDRVKVVLRLHKNHPVLQSRLEHLNELYGISPSDTKEKSTEKIINHFDKQYMAIKDKIESDLKSEIAKHAAMVNSGKMSKEQAEESLKVIGQKLMHAAKSDLYTAIQTKDQGSIALVEYMITKGTYEGKKLDKSKAMNAIKANKNTITPSEFQSSLKTIKAMIGMNQIENSLDAEIKAQKAKQQMPLLNPELTERRNLLAQKIPAPTVIMNGKEVTLPPLPDIPQRRTMTTGFKASQKKQSQTTATTEEKQDNSRKKSFRN